jgi:hypothetical protein
MLEFWGSHIGDKSTLSWYLTSCNFVEIYRRFGGNNCLHLHGKSQVGNKHKACTEVSACSFHLASYLAYSSTPKMQTIHSSETSALNFYLTTRHLPQKTKKTNYEKPQSG